MEPEQKSLSLNDLFSRVEQQLRLILQSRDSRGAQQALQVAEELIGMIEGMVLADPMVTEEHIRRIVEYTRGPIWNQARQHAAKLPALSIFAIEQQS